MNKYLVISTFLASMFLVAIWASSSVRAQDDMPQWKKDQTQVGDHIKQHLDYLHTKRDCVAAATSFETLRDCGATMFDSALCQW